MPPMESLSIYLVEQSDITVTTDTMSITEVTNTTVIKVITITD